MLEKSLVMHMDKWCKGGIGKEDGDISFEGVPYQLSTVARTTLQRTALSATISLSIQYAIFTIFSDQGANNVGQTHETIFSSDLYPDQRK